MLRGFPRQPASHAPNHEIVLRVLALENLAPQLRLLVGREGAPHLDAADVALEVVLAVVHLLQFLLVLQQEDLVLLGHVGLLDLVLVRLLELAKVLHDVVNVDGVLLREVRNKVLDALDLPVIIHPLNELFEVKVVLLGDDLFGREEGHDAVALVRQFGVLVEIVHHAVLVARRKRNLLVRCGAAHYE